MNARGTIVTEYKTMVTTISQNGNYFRCLNINFPKVWKFLEITSYIFLLHTIV